MSYEQPPRRKKAGLPTWAGILAFLGIVGTILGVITGVIALFQFGQQALGGPPTVNANQQNVYATLAAVQIANNQLVLQLTQNALAVEEAANQATSNAILARSGTIEAQRAALQTRHDSLVATQHANAALTATGQAAVQAAAATATQNVLNTGATNAAISQVTPTSTALPTATATPAPVADYRSLTAATAASQPDGRVSLSIQAAQPIPPQPPVGLAYVWMLDTDRNPSTGLAVQDIGVDLMVTARFDNGAWLGTVNAVLADGTKGTDQVFTDIQVTDNTLTVTLDPTQFNFQPSFDWLARSQSDQETYPLLPATGHFTFPSS